MDDYRRKYFQENSQWRTLPCSDIWKLDSKTLATWCEGLTHLKRPWYWERLKAGGEGDNRGWDGWMVSPTQWTWVLVNSGSWQWTGRPGMLQSMGLWRVGHDWVTELSWTRLKWYYLKESNMLALNKKSPRQNWIAAAYIWL